MLDIFMKKIYKSPYENNIYNTCFKISDSEDDTRNSVIGSVTINTQTEKIKLRIMYILKDNEYILEDNSYLLSYEEKVLVLCELFNQIYICPKEALSYSIINYKFIESNRTDKEYREKFCTFIEELKKYRYDISKKTKVIVHILNALSIVEKYEDCITSRQRVFVDYIKDLNKKEIKVYYEIILSYLINIGSYIRLRIEEKRRIFKSNYYIIMEKLVKYTISPFPSIMSELLQEYYKEQEEKNKK